MEGSKAAQEYLLFADPLKVKNGIMVFEESDPYCGKMITWLGELPENKIYVTTNGTKIERISAFEVKVDNKRIPFPITNPRMWMQFDDRVDDGMFFNPKPLKPYEGESVFLVAPSIELVISETKRVPGVLFVTNYQLLLQWRDASGMLREVCVAPLATISKVEKQGGKKAAYIRQTKDILIILHRKDFHSEVKLVTTYSPVRRKTIVELINKLAFHGDIRRLFPFIYKPKWPTTPPQLEELSRTLRSDVNIDCDGWALYQPIMEMSRIGIAPAWRWSDVNRGFAVCKSYPEKFVVPSDVSDSQLIKVAQFRTKGRMPILSWIHPRTKASLTRSSQPRVGALSSRCTEDEQLLKSIMMANRDNPSSLIILDARPRANAEANRAVGAGYEKSDYYKGTQTIFLDIANIHVMRNSQMSLRNLISQTTAQNDSNWLSQLESTNWLHHIKSLLAGASKVIKHMHIDGQSVLVHCSDGWDRTAQCVALAMLCMDPYYRTISGFCILIEKEWIQLGHMFQTRMGHVSSTNLDERAPIFLQWMDCVWQLLHQYPTSFEFNEAFLIRIIDEATNCRFGTFLTDSEYQRQQYRVVEETPSLWTYLHRRENFARYLNPLYVPPTQADGQGRTVDVIFPRYSISMLDLWHSYYLRSKSYRKSNDIIFARAQQLQLRILELQNKLAQYQRENAELQTLVHTYEQLLQRQHKEQPQDTVNNGPKQQPAIRSTTQSSQGESEKNGRGQLALPPLSSLLPEAQDVDDDPEFTENMTGDEVCTYSEPVSDQSEMEQTRPQKPHNTATETSVSAPSTRHSGHTFKSTLIISGSVVEIDDDYKPSVK